VSDRERFWLISVLLVAAVLVSAWVSAERVEKEVLAGVQLALSAAEIPFYGVEVDGRDVVLRGLVPSADVAARMVAHLARVPGVRRVRDETCVERVAAADRAAAIELVPEVRIQRLGGRVRVSGRLPSTALAAAWVNSLAGRIGAERVKSTLVEDARVDGQEWLSESQAVAALVAQLEAGGLLTVRGGAATISGTVRTAAQRDRIVEAARAVRSLSWRFELFALDGSVSGARP
jgi:hypothetical protein